VPVEEPLRFSGVFPDQFETGVVLVTFMRSATAEDRAAVLAKVAARRSEVVTPEFPDLALVRVADGTEDAAVERLSAAPRVRWVRKNWARYPTGEARKGAVPLGQGGGQQMPYNVAPSNAPLLRQIAEPGEADGGIRGGDVRVAVIDEGHEPHLDLPVPIAITNVAAPGFPVSDPSGHGALVSGFVLDWTTDCAVSARHRTHRLS
jgi:hypothetical protein